MINTNQFASFAPAPRAIKLIADLIADHQRTAPHHADMCALCIEAKAVLMAAGPQ